MHCNSKRGIKVDIAANCQPMPAMISSRIDSRRQHACRCTSYIKQFIHRLSANVAASMAASLAVC